MSDPNDLLYRMKAAEEAGDPDALDAAREAYVAAAPDTEEATWARYRLGLSCLFRHKDTDRALLWFKLAAGDKRTDIAKEARISLALLLNAKQKRQQAIFELRKLLPQGEPATMHTANALDFLSVLLRESKAQQKDIDAVETRRQEHLETLGAASDDAVEKAHWLLRLGAAHVDASGPGDIAKAKSAFTAVVKLGKAAGDSAVKTARAQLRTLPR